MIEKHIAMTPPPPMPCNPRVRISWSMVCEMPASIEPTMKMTIATWNRRRRP